MEASNALAQRPGRLAWPFTAKMRRWAFQTRFHHRVPFPSNNNIPSAKLPTPQSLVSSPEATGHLDAVVLFALGLAVGFLTRLWCSGGASAASPWQTLSGAGTRDLQILALGDSYTIGEAVAETERWPVQLAALLRREFGVGAAVTVVARTGWTTDELWAATAQADLRPPYDLVTLLIGVNNQFRGRNINSYQADFRFLLGKAVEYARGDPQRVVVLSIPDWGATPFGAGRSPAKVAAEIDAFNAINRAEAAAAGVPYVDVTPGSRRAAADPGLVAGDGLHPSSRMYGEWAAAALPVVARGLGLGSGA